MTQPWTAFELLLTNTIVDIWHEGDGLIFRDINWNKFKQDFVPWFRISIKLF